MSIKENASLLKLPFIKEYGDEYIKEAELLELGYEKFLDNLLSKELENRMNNGIKHRIKQAKFPYKILLSDYETDHLSTEIRMKIKELQTLQFIQEKQNVILVGNPGTGKTALAIALGMKACEENKTVLFINVPNLLLELKEAMSANQVTAYKKKFEKYDLVICDELGYCTFDQERGEILFNLLSNRNEAGSIIITSNLGFDRWNEVFRDQVLTGAIVDRLAFKSHMIDMTGESYRIMATKKWSEKESKNHGK